MKAIFKKSSKSIWACLLAVVMAVSIIVPVSVKSAKADVVKPEKIEATDKEVAGISHSLRKQEYQQAGMDYSIVNKLEYKYLGEKEVDGRQVIYIQLEDESAYTKFVIDKETGIIVNRIDLSKVFIFTAHKNETKRELKLDVVTDENVARPDLSRYEVVGE